MIVFGDGGLIRRVAAGGGEASDVMATDGLFSWPSFVPDGRHFLYASAGAILVASLDAPKGQRLLAADSNAVYAPGYVLFMRQGVLLAQTFDPASLKTSGDPIPIADHIAYHGIANLGAFSVSETGVVTYRTGSGGGVGATTQLTWLDRAGKQTGLLGSPGAYGNQAISPDGTRIAVDQDDPSIQKNICCSSPQTSRFQPIGPPTASI